MKTRKKGYRSEHELERTLRSMGIEAKRITLSGHSSHTGDIILKFRGRELMGEVKAWERGFPEYEMLEHSDIVFKRTISVKETKPWLVVVPLSKFINYLKNGD